MRCCLSTCRCFLGLLLLPLDLSLCSIRPPNNSRSIVSIISLYQFTLHPQGKTAAETPWTTWTWKQYRAELDAFGKALIFLGCEKFDAINIIGFNAPEWLFANFGAIAAGCVPAGIYTTNNPESCEYVAKHSGAKVVVCEGMKQMSKFFGISKNLPNLKALVMYGPDSLPADIESKCSVPCYTFADFTKLGKDSGKDAELKARSDSWKPGETCTLIYTSGTTGPPKAVMITNVSSSSVCSLNRSQ